MSAASDTRILMQDIFARTGAVIDFDDANTLRRAQLTLRRWFELECGDGNEYGSWAIERDDNGEGAPFMVNHHYMHGKGKDFTSRTRIADREAGARKRIKDVCERNKLHFYIQGDPRGCSLYVSREPIQDNDYNRGVACCGRG